MTPLELLLNQHCRLAPFDHQVVGVDALTKWDDPATGRVVGGVFFLADEMGAGKTKQIIDSAQLLYVQDEIDRVVIMCPNAVKDVWADPELGELQKHLWTEVPNLISEYHARIKQWNYGPESKTPLRWVITNYDFIRNEDRLNYLKAHCNARTWFVLDESSAIKNVKAHQTQSCYALRKVCGRVTLLNGTPISHSPGDLFSQARMMDPSILGCKTWYQFRSKYAIMGGFMQKQIIGWRDLEDIQRRMAPYVLRRLKADCMDLPEKMPAVVITVPLSPETWRKYTEMRDEMVTWLSETTVVSAAQAIGKVMRMAQITSGFLGGVTDESCEHSDLDADGLCLLCGEPKNEERKPELAVVQEISREKLDCFLSWFEDRLVEDPNFKVLVWCRFRPELARVLKALQDKITTMPEHVVPSVWQAQSMRKLQLGEIRGSQKKEERAFARRLLDPRTTPSGPVVVVGTPTTGSLGLNLTAAHTVVYLSNDYSLMTRKQSEDRVHRTGQTHVVNYYDMVATGPKGQQTIDHVIIKSLRTKDALATWTTSAWVTALRAE